MDKDFSCDLALVQEIRGKQAAFEKGLFAFKKYKENISLFLEVTPETVQLVWGKAEVIRMFKQNILGD